MGLIIVKLSHHLPRDCSRVYNDFLITHGTCCSPYEYCVHKVTLVQDTKCVKSFINVLYYVPHRRLSVLMTYLNHSSGISRGQGGLGYWYEAERGCCLGVFVPSPWSRGRSQCDGEGTHWALCLVWIHNGHVCFTSISLDGTWYELTIGLMHGMGHASISLLPNFIMLCRVMGISSGMGLNPFAHWYTVTSMSRCPCGCIWH